jgi:hypothetical protein
MRVRLAAYWPWRSSSPDRGEPWLFWDLWRCLCSELSAEALVYYYYYLPAMFPGVAIVTVLSRANGPRVFGIRVSVLILVAAAVFSFLYCYPRMMALEAPYDCMFGCWS